MKEFTETDIERIGELIDSQNQEAGSARGG